MRKYLISKILALSVIFLFIGVSFSSAISTQNVSSKSEYTEQEVREVLFKTIVDVVNNPKVKEQLKSDEYQIRIKDGSYQNIIRKILFRNPSLISSIFMLRQGITYDSLNKVYDIGLKLYKVLDEDELLQLENSIEVTSQCDCGEISDLIDDIELHHKFAQFDICRMLSFTLNTIVISIVLPLVTITAIFQDIPFIYEMLVYFLEPFNYIIGTLCTLYKDTYDCGWHIWCD